jgi:hypothetical protein
MSGTRLALRVSFARIWNSDVMAGSGHPADFVGGDPVVPAIHVLVWKPKPQ